MARMRSRLGLLLLLGACGDGDANPPPEPDAPKAPPIHWVKTQAPGWDLELWVPEPWTRGYAARGDQIFFAGPEADAGWQPELQFGWRQTATTLDSWAGERIRYLQSLPFGRIDSEGSATVAGMAARYFVYAFQRRGESGPQEMREVNFYFGGHGCLGFVRGVCTARTFSIYQPIYLEAAARLRYNPQ
jgi:hypothetical protein